MGGIDNADCDRPDWNQDMVVKAVERAIRDGSMHSFIPSLTAGGPASTFPGVYAAVTAEIERINQDI